MNLKFYKFMLFLILPVFMVGCFASVNRDPGILSQEPYSKITYIKQPTAKMKLLDTIKVTTRGYSANILNTIPVLYKRGLTYQKENSLENLKLYISNIILSSFTKREKLRVPYQDCKFVTETVPVTSTVCSGSGPTRTCRTTTTYRMVTRQKCTTKYRTVLTNVLYQNARAEIYKGE